MSLGRGFSNKKPRFSGAAASTEHVSLMEEVDLARAIAASLVGRECTEQQTTLPPALHPLPTLLNSDDVALGDADGAFDGDDEDSSWCLGISGPRVSSAAAASASSSAPPASVGAHRAKVNLGGSCYQTSAFVAIAAGLKNVLIHMHPSADAAARACGASIGEVFPAFHATLQLALVYTDAAHADIAIAKLVSAAVSSYDKRLSPTVQDDSFTVARVLLRALHCEMRILIPFLLQLPGPLDDPPSAPPKPLGLVVAVAAALARRIAVLVVSSDALAGQARPPLSVAGGLTPLAALLHTPEAEWPVGSSDDGTCSARVCARALRSTLCEGPADASPMCAKDTATSLSLLILREANTLLPQHAAGLHALEVALERENVMPPSTLARRISWTTPWLAALPAAAAGLPEIPRCTLQGATHTVLTCPSCKLESVGQYSPFFSMLCLPLPDVPVSAKPTSARAVVSGAGDAPAPRVASASKTIDLTEDAEPSPTAPPSARPAPARGHDLQDLVVDFFSPHPSNGSQCPTCTVDRTTRDLLVDPPLFLAFNIVRHTGDLSEDAAEGLRPLIAAVGLLRKDPLRFTAELNMGHATSTPSIDVMYDLYSVSYFKGDSARAGHCFAGARALAATEGSSEWSIVDDYASSSTTFKEISTPRSWRHVVQLYYFRRDPSDAAPVAVEGGLDSSAGSPLVSSESVPRLPAAAPVHRAVITAAVAAAVGREPSLRLVRVLRHFGINGKRARELTMETLPAVVALHEGSPRFCPEVNNSSLQTLLGDLNADVVDSYLGLVARSSDKTCVSGGATMTEFMPASAKRPDLIQSLSRGLRGQHLLCDAIHAVHLPHHWILLMTSPPVPDAPPETPVILRILDPLGASRARSRSAIAATHTAWLTNEFTAAGRPSPPFTVNYNPADLPCQDDGASCGCFTGAYPYFWCVHRRLPTTSDFSGADHVALRLAQLDALVTGALRVPLAALGSDLDDMTALPLEAIAQESVESRVANRAAHSLACSLLPSTAHPGMCDLTEDSD